MKHFTYISEAKNIYINIYYVIFIPYYTYIWCQFLLYTLDYNRGFLRSKIPCRSNDDYPYNNKDKLSISCKLQIYGLYIPFASLYIFFVSIKIKLSFNELCMYIYVYIQLARLYVYICNIYIYTLCPRSSDPFYIITFYIKWITIS